MRFDRSVLCFIASAALLWSALTTLSVFLRDELNAVVLLSVPGAVVNAAFMMLERRYWPHFSAVVFLVQITTFSLLGIPLQMAIIFSCAILLQASIAATFFISMMGKRSGQPSSLRSIASVFATSNLSCFIGSAIALTAVPNPSWQGFLSWFLINTIGIVAVTPVLMRWRGLFWSEGGIGNLKPSRKLILASICFVALSFAVLTQDSLALAPLLVTAAVFFTFHFGNQYSSLAVLAFAIVAGFLSASGVEFLPSLGVSEAQRTLTLQTWMLVMLMTNLPVAAMLKGRDDLQATLVLRNADLNDSLTLFDLAEQVAGIGRWRMDLRTGEQHWSQRLLEMYGLPAELGAETGGQHHLLEDCGKEIVDAIEENASRTDPFTFDYGIRMADGERRILRINILNQFDEIGRRIGLFGVAMDVTEQVSREQALEKAHGRAVSLAAEAQKLANTDPMTELPNRRYTFSRLDEMVADAKSNAVPLAALMFDIDHFKQVNDTFGHQVGDDVIVQVAQIAAAQAREDDVVGRIGGEEFVWLLPGLPENAANALAERLRAAVAKGNASSGLPQTTISIGVACYRPGDTGEALLARADAALYRAKESGRNQVRRAA